MLKVVRLLLLLGVLAVLALPAAAIATPQQAVRDCVVDGDLDRTYSNAELRRALDLLASDSNEYSDCPDVLEAAIKGGSDRGKGRGSPGLGTTDPAAEAAAQQQDQAALEAIAAAKAAQSGKPPSVRIGDETVEPGPNGIFDLATAANKLPLPLLLALVALSLLALAAGLASLQERSSALGRFAILSKIPTPRVPLPWRR
ncbi:MAG TPA: hypothetical protein VEY90_09645 [Thermoleophilaceae bacterium]|jgi:hypothetical protein|nr:hypothetical protein [Thermoleophilaceae bacterium]